LSTLRRSVQSWCATGILPLRGSGITRTALDISSSERALRLAGLGTLRILARGDRKAARLDRCITQWLKIDVFFTRLPLLHIVDRCPSGDHDALGRVAHKAGDLVVTHDETAAVVFDGLEYLGLRRVSASETFFRLGCETVGALPLVRIPRAWTALHPCGTSNSTAIDSSSQGQRFGFDNGPSTGQPPRPRLTQKK